MSHVPSANDTPDPAACPGADEYLIDPETLCVIPHPHAARSAPLPALLRASLDPAVLLQEVRQFPAERLLRVLDHALPPTVPYALQLLRLGGRVLLLATRVAGQRPAGPDIDLGMMVESMPGLVYQAHMDAAGDFAFQYLSNACVALLGKPPEAFLRDPQLFLSLILPEDRAGYEERLQHSAGRLNVLNWTGRLRMEEWHDTKWINLRAFPRRVGEGRVQWSGLMTNVTRSKLEQLEVEKSHQQLSEMSSHMAKVKEQERLEIAREIHDDVGGNLTAIELGLSSILKGLGPEQEALAARIRRLVAVVDQTFEAVHRISGNLRPDVLDLGIVAAMEWQVQEFQKQMGLRCEFASSHAEVPLSTDQAIVLYRICQEAMSNIAKYAHASEVKVCLEYDRQQITMKVFDDGIGIRLGDMLKPNAFGLRGMAERAAALSGSCRVYPGEERGTVVSVVLPVVPEGDGVSPEATGVTTF